MPQDAAGGWTPSPRKDRAASIMMAVDRLNVACTITGASALGRMARSMIRPSCAPRAREASTNSFCLTDSAVPRTTREKIGM